MTQPWTSEPHLAWCDHIRPHLRAGWLEDSAKIIPEVIDLSKRELFGLILFAQIYSHVTGNNWIVGYDINQSEPNDGFISDRDSAVMFEHKIVAQQDGREALEAILGTYKKYEKRGRAYGEHRTMLIHPNKSSNGAIRISALNDEIGNQCPFDRVFSLVAVKFETPMVIMHIIQHFPPDTRPAFPGKGISQINFDMANGRGTVASHGVDVP